MVIVMTSVANKIIDKIQQDGPGSVFTSSDFIDLGSRQAVDTALSRLVTQGAIRRLSRGLYDYPKKHHLLGDLLPSLDDVALVIARDTNSTIQISGARALYLLGLTNQVPAQSVYLTDGRSRDIQIGGATLTLRHTSPKMMTGAGSKAGTILQAIRYLGKNHLNDNVLDKLTQQLDNADKQDLKNISRYAPGWAKPSINKLLTA